MIKNFFLSITQHYGNLGILIGLLLEYIGLPVPGETLMAYLGFLTWNGTNNSLILSVLYASIGTYLGSLFAYIIGFKYGRELLLKYGKFIFITKEKLYKVEKLFNKNKYLILLFNRYIIGVRHVVPYICGISKVKFRLFLFYNIISSVVWCTSFIWVGYIMGVNWSKVEMIAKGYLYIIILLIIFIFIILKYFGRYKKIIFLTTLPTLLFIKLCEDLIKNELTVFDTDIYNFVSSFISKDITNVMKFITYMGSPTILIAITLLLFLIFIFHKKNLTINIYIIFINLFAIWIFNELFKAIFHRQRPDVLRLVKASGYSFPSGHSMVSISFYGLIIYLLCRYINNRLLKYTITFFLCLLILFIGISRIYLGVHYASDVLAGFSAGLAWLVIYVSIINKYYICNNIEKYKK